MDFFAGDGKDTLEHFKTPNDFLDLAGGYISLFQGLSRNSEEFVKHLELFRRLLPANLKGKLDERSRALLLDSICEHHLCE